MNHLVHAIQLQQQKTCSNVCALKKICIIVSAIQLLSGLSLSQHISYQTFNNLSLNLGIILD